MLNQPTCNGCMRYNGNGNNLGNCIEKKPRIYTNENKTIYNYCPCMTCIVKVMCTKLCIKYFSYASSPKSVTITQHLGGAYYDLQR